MDFTFTDEQTMFRDMAHAFAVRHIEPVASDNDLNEHFPMEILTELARQGLMGIAIPVEYGGLGADHVCLAIIAEEIARSCQSTAVSAFCAHSVAEEVLAKWGTQTQKEQYLPLMCQGRLLSGYALTDQGKNGNLTAFDIQATSNGAGWILKGNKRCVINGSTAHLIIGAAVSTSQEGRHNTEAFLINKEIPDLSANPITGRRGLRAADIADLVFEDCRLSMDSVLGDSGVGVKIAADTLDTARFSFAATYTGAAQACIDASVSYAQDRWAFGKPIGSFDMVQDMIGDMIIGIESARLLIYQAAYCMDNGLPYTNEAFMAKYLAAETAIKTVTNAIQVHGAYGYVREYQLERYLRDLTVSTLYEGAPLTDKLMVARRALNLA